MKRVRLIALGSPHGGDDEVALTLAQRLARDDVDLVLAGRPGVGLVDLLDTALPVVLLDVVRSGASAGTLFELPLEELCDRALAIEPISSHGFGPAEALRLAAALGRELPTGRLLGIEAASCELGAGLSPQVRAQLPELERRVRAAIDELSESGVSCTSPD